jgi:protein-tyrosine phosphatase
MWVRRQARPASIAPSTPPASSFPSCPLRGRKARAAQAAAQARKPRNVLFHTGDGYTDTSVLALSYIMYDRACSLPQAYLHLQNECQRSFFVYPADVMLLSRIETRIQAVIAEERRAANAAMEVDPPESPAPSGLLRGRFGRSASPACVPRPVSVPVAQSHTEKMIAAPFFYNERFDGHFPSRILPFLYLGNLNHATNALMLKELGITHVVSIGETAMIPPRSPCESPLGVPMHLKARIPTNSLWLEASLGNIEVLDLRDIADDGIDPIRGYIEQSQEFIEEARRKGGKVLVHCRVGVSRSASLVIAFVMKHLELDLQSAYLLVRSRRLNILIQVRCALVSMCYSDVVPSPPSCSCGRSSGTRRSSTRNAGPRTSDRSAHDWRGATWPGKCSSSTRATSTRLDRLTAALQNVASLSRPHATSFIGVMSALNPTMGLRLPQA